jgi:hypothetical protein
MKTFRYILSRGPQDEPIVTVQNAATRQTWPLDPDQSWKLFKHSPDGFEWGYDGSGPAQLALAMLADYFGHCDILPTLALQFYQNFKRQFIATAPHNGAVITQDQIDTFLDTFISDETHT